MKKKIILWLDDIRDPYEGGWGIFSPINLSESEFIWVKSYDQFTKWITENGLPDGICFDHDLGEDIAKDNVSKGMSKRKARSIKRESKSGFDCAKWLIEYCLNNNLDLPKYNIQSANPVGKDNINGLLQSYIRHRLKH